MKENAYLIRGAFYLVLLIGTCLIPVTLAQRKTWCTPANIITVTNLNDSGPGSLRQALADANDGDTIEFAVTGTIQLTSVELAINNSIIISGPGADSLAVFSNTFRIFHVLPGLTVTIAGLAIRGGFVQFDFGGGILNDHATLTLTNCAVDVNEAFGGGGIYNDGAGGSAALTIVDSTVTANRATGGIVGFGGGGIYNDGSLTIINSTISGNFADSGFPYNLGIGGGIFSQSGTLTITNSTIAGNFAGNRGGGISSCATLAITDSTVSGNGAGGGKNNWPGSGGGIEACGTVTISNSTISGNSVSGRDFEEPGFGGGIYAVGTVTISNSTLSDNLVFNYGNGGCIWNGETVEIEHTILNGGQPDNIFSSFGTVTSKGYNLSSDDGGGYLNGPGDQINTDPMLGPLQDNGGPTLTHALLPGSPAIDAGDPSFTPPPFYDQRGPGFDRVANSRIDSGSFEVQATPTPTPTPTAGPITLRARKKRIEGINTVRLQWRGTTSTNVDVYRNNVLIVTTLNDGQYDDSTGDTGRAQYVYRVCEAGTPTCSNDVTVHFPP
jgi:hypothetical protein